MGILWQDIRHGARRLRKDFRVAAIAMFTLALGIGTNTAIFSLVDVVLFRPLPIVKPDRVVRLTGGRTKDESRWPLVSFPSYLQYSDLSVAFSGMAAYLDQLPVNFSGDGFGAERVNAGMVTGSYFQTLGVKAQIGRAIVPEDDKPGANPVVMLSNDLWRSQFAANESVLGMTVIIDGQQFTVIGIGPAGFGGVSFENLPKVWIPMNDGFQVDPLLKIQIPLQRESFAPFGVIARLKHGVSITQAQAQLDTIAANMGAGRPDARDGFGFLRRWPVIVPASAEARSGRDRYSYLVLAITTLVLLIACVDAAGLLLARAESRQKEVAVRLALGATRVRIIRLHLIEGVLLAVPAAMLGSLLAFWTAQVLASSAPPTLPIPLERAESILDVRVLAFTAFIAIIAGILSSFVPALKYSDARLIEVIKKSESSSVNVLARHVSLQSAMVVMQLAISVLLFVGTGLMIRTLLEVSRVKLGFDPEHTVVASTDPIREGYDKAAAAGLLGPLLDSLRAEPGVESAALGSSLPLQRAMGTSVVVEGHESNRREGDWVQIVMVSPGYFNTLGIPLLRGRDFTASDTANAPPVAIIDQAMAQEYWPSASPVGKHIEDVGPNNQTLEIVGAVGNVAPEDLRKIPGPVVYVPIVQAYLMFPWQPDINLLARNSSDPRAIIPSLRAAVEHVNSNLPVFRVHTMKKQVASTLVEERFLTRLLVAFALLATLLCAAGIYGLISYTTDRSTRELGIRVALGAQPRVLLWTVLRRGLILAAVGSILGLVLAVIFTKLLVSFLYGITPTDPITFAGAVLLVGSVTVLASYLPARRAMCVDPVVALRYE